MPYTSGNLTVLTWSVDNGRGEGGGSRRGKHTAALFHTATLDVRMAVRGDDFVWLSDESGLNYIDSLLKSKILSKRHGNTWIRRFRREDPSVVEPCVQSQDRSNWTFLENWTLLETRTHNHQIIWMQRGDQDSEYTTREITRQIGVRRKKECNFERKKMQHVHETFLCGPGQIRPGGSSKTFGPEDERSTRIRSCSPGACSTVSCGETQSCSTIPKKHVDNITLFLNTDFAADRVLEIKHDGIGGADWVGYTQWNLDPHVRASQRWAWEMKESQVGLSLRSIYMDLGIHMKGEIQSDRSTAKYFTDLLGAGPRTKHIFLSIPFGYKNEFKTEISISRKFLQRKIVQILERSQLQLQYYNSIANLHDWYSTDHGPHTKLLDDERPVEWSRRRMCKTERNGRLLELVKLVETGAKLSENRGTVEELRTWHDEWPMTEKERRRRRRRRKREAMCDE